MRRGVAKFAVSILFGLLGLWAVASVAQAAEAEPAEASQPRIVLDGVGAVTLQRSSVFDSPRATSAVETSELRFAPPRSVGDALRNEEAVFVQQPSYGFQSPNLRGLGEGRVQIYVDGIRLNTTITSTVAGGLSNLNLVDPYIVRGIEVVRGPGLNTYGDGGLGGTIYLRTMRPNPIAGSNVELTADVRGAYASPDQGAQGSLSGGGRWSRFALDTAFSVRRFQDVVGGSQGGVQPLTGYSEGGLYIGAGVDLGAGSIILVYQGMRQYDGLRSERSQPGDLYALPEVARDLGYLRYERGFEVRGQTVAVSATLSYQRQAESVARQELLADSILKLANRVDVFGAMLNARADLGRAGRLALGIEGQFEWVDSLATRSVLHEGAVPSALLSPGEARYPEGSRAQTLAVFLQDDIDLERLVRGSEGDRPGRLRALVGARAGANLLHIGHDDRVQKLLGSLQADELPERQFSSPIYGGSLHLRYELFSGLALTAGAMTGMRVPNLDDYARLDGGRPGLLLPTSGPLRSEAAHAGEFGLRTAYRRLEAAAYYALTYLDSPIVVVPVSIGSQSCRVEGARQGCERFLSRANGDSALMHSVEASLRVYMFRGLSALASVNYNYMDGQSDGAPTVGRVPPVHGLAALEFSRPRAVFSFAQLVLRWAGPQRRLAPEDLLDSTVCLPNLPPGMCNGTAGFFVLSLRSALELKRQIHLTGVLDNITNNSYRFHGSGVDGSGVGVHVAVEATY